MQAEPIEQEANGKQLGRSRAASGDGVGQRPDEGIERRARAPESAEDAPAQQHQPGIATPQGDQRRLLEIEAPCHLAGQSAKTAVPGAGGEASLADPAPDEGLQDGGERRAAGPVRALHQSHEPGGGEGGRAADAAGGDHRAATHRLLRTAARAPTSVGW